MIKKSEPPETLAQARRWDRRKRIYIEAGLCNGCAGQAAYGHQWYGGAWAKIHPPCVRCAPIVATFPVACGKSAWRRLHGEAWSGVES